MDNYIYNYVSIIMKRENVANTSELITDFKKMQCESCELSFIWGKMRTIAWDSISDSSEKLL